MVDPVFVFGMESKVHTFLFFFVAFNAIFFQRLINTAMPFIDTKNQIKCVALMLRLTYFTFVHERISSGTKDLHDSWNCIYLCCTGTSSATDLSEDLVIKDAVGSRWRATDPALFKGSLLYNTHKKNLFYSNITVPPGGQTVSRNPLSFILRLSHFSVIIWRCSQKAI